eukprot:SAG25_NODE_8929_length_396_cov_1.087542_1_plen_100_part_10
MTPVAYGCHILEGRADVFGKAAELSPINEHILNWWADHTNAMVPTQRRELHWAQRESSRVSPACVGREQHSGVTRRAADAHTAVTPGMRGCVATQRRPVV